MLNVKQARLNALRQLLVNSDYQAIKYSEGAIPEDKYVAIKEQRQAWRDEINELESVAEDTGEHH